MTVRRMIPAVALAGVLACPLLGQGPTGPPQPRLEELKAFLALTDTQIQALQQLRRQEVEAVRTLREEMLQKQRSLGEQIRGGSTDAAALGRLLLDIEALRKRMGDAQSSLQGQAVNFLTADQKTKLSTLEASQKLGPAIQQATAVGLLAPPQNTPDGAGFGPGGGIAPGPRMPIRPGFGRPRP